MPRIRKLFNVIFRQLSNTFSRKEPDAFSKFQRNIHKLTWSKHDSIINWAENFHKTIYNGKGKLTSFDDPLLRQTDELLNDLEIIFRDKYVNDRELKILIHLPDARFSPGGYSLFSNLAEGLQYIGIDVGFLRWGDTIDHILKKFKPTVFLSSDHVSYLDRIDWSILEDYKKKNRLLVGLTASISEYGNSPLNERLNWAQNNGIDFYYSFRSQEYLLTRKEYRPFYDSDYNILTIEFGANPLLYHPLPGIERDLYYVFLASSNPDKWERYFKYLPKIVNKYPGFIDGPGWLTINKWADRSIHRYLYARSRVGINLHIADSIDWPSELNERTYILAACGVPQLVDNAMLLGNRFEGKCFFVARNEKEYHELFLYIINNPDVAQERALNAQREVFKKHSSFHRADHFIKQLLRII